MQDTKAWLAADDARAPEDPADVAPLTPEKSKGTSWGEARADASWDSPGKDLPSDPFDDPLHDYKLGDVIDDESDFTVVESKKKKKGRQQAAAGNAHRARGRR